MLVVKFIYRLLYVLKTKVTQKIYNNIIHDKASIRCQMHYTRGGKSVRQHHTASA